MLQIPIARRSRERNSILSWTGVYGCAKFLEEFGEVCPIVLAASSIAGSPVKCQLSVETSRQDEAAKRIFPVIIHTIKPILTEKAQDFGYCGRTFISGGHHLWKDRLSASAVVAKRPTTDRGNHLQASILGLQGSDIDEQLSV